MNYLRLFVAFLRVNILAEMAYRVNFFLQLFESTLELATSLLGLAVIFSYTNSLGGWRPDEVLALVGVYFLVGGIIGMVIHPALDHLIEAVRDGTLDYVLTKPDDAQVLVSLQRIGVWKSVDIMLGCMVLAIALVRLGAETGPLQAFIFGLMLVSGGIIIYSFWLMLATLSFWLVRVENILMIFQSMYEAGRWPITLYPAWLRFALTFVVPVAFATTVPAEALTGKLSTPTLGITIASAALLFLLSRVVWKIGLRQYSGTSA
jgi:ABC-2 type transport system permease protein